VDVTNSIVWGNIAEYSPYPQIYGSVSVTYTDVEGGWTGTGNIDVDPLFVNPANGDFHLQGSSPCIDAGDNSAPDLPLTDIDGEARIIDGNGDSVSVVDMGADEVFLNPCDTLEDCEDENPCTEQACVNHLCIYTYNTDPCDDGDACTMNDVCSAGVCLGVALDEDGDTYVSDVCGGDDCRDDPTGDPPICDSCACGVIECAPCARCQHPGATDFCGDGIDSDCDGETPYPCPANAIASTYGNGSLVGSGIFNELTLLLIPIGAVIFLRIFRRKK